MMSDKIRKLLYEERWTVPMLAKALGTSSQNLYNKLGRDNFSEKELLEIADAIGCDLEMNFILKDGKMI